MPDNPTTRREMPEFLREYARHHPPGKWSTVDWLCERIKGGPANCFSTKWAQWDRPCGTLAKNEISLAGIIHPDRDRYLNLPEIKRIGSFPDAFRFPNGKGAPPLIGDSVPPLFMKALAGHIRDEILGRK